MSTISPSEYFAISGESCTFIEMLNDDRKARLLDAICAKIRGGEMPPLDDATDIVFRVLDRDNEKFSLITKSSLVLDVIAEDQERNKKKVCPNGHTKEKKERMPDSLLTDDAVFAAFAEYEKMRKLIKKPLTDLAKTRAINKLERLSNNDPGTAVAILNQSVDHCWQDLYELKTEVQHELPRQRSEKIQKAFGFSTERKESNYNELVWQNIRKGWEENAGS